MAANATKVKSPGKIIGCCYAALLAGFVCAAVVPYVRTVDGARADIARSTNEIATRQENGAKLEAVRKSIELLELETRNYDRLVPANDDYGAFVTSVTDQLYKAGMKDITLSALQPTPLGKALRKPIEIKGKGTYEQFQTFLVALEGLNRQSSVGKLAIEADAEMNGIITASFTVYIYSTNNSAVKAGA
jgi:Tfp pilus assembly protein PilO